MSAGGGLAVLSAGLKEVAKNRRFASLPEPISLGALASADWDRMVHVASTDGTATGIASVKTRRDAPRASRLAASLLSVAASPRKQSIGAPAQQTTPEDTSSQQDDDDEGAYEDALDALEPQDETAAGTPSGKASKGLFGGIANGIVSGAKALASYAASSSSSTE
jgi:hypothetical protein